MYLTRLLFLLFSLSVSNCICQDTLFFQDFQSQTLGNLTTVDNDMELLDGVFTGFNGAFNIVPVSGPNDFRALGISFFIDTTAVADNWLISPELTIPGRGAVLKWKASSLSGEAEKLDDYRVLISTGSSELSDFSQVIYNQKDESFSQIERTVGLSDYAGQTIRIAFNQVGIDNYALTLDDILVLAPTASTSIELVRIVGDRYQDLNNRSLSLEIVNNGSETITSLTASGSINGQGGDSFFPNLNILPQDTAYIPFGDLYPFEADKYEIVPTISSINGIPFVGDTLTETYFMVANPPSRTFVYEEATSTSCGWCIEGLVWKDIMDFKYKDEVINISVHTDDPMRNVVYDFGLQNQPGFQGFPSAFVNRANHMSHTEVESYFLNEFGKVAPMSMEIDYNYDEASRSIDVTIRSEAHTTLQSDLHRYSFLILEDNVSGNTLDFAQANNYSFEASNITLIGLDNIDWSELSDPVPALNMSYDDVVREVIGGYEGIIGSISNAVNGDNNIYDLNYVLPSPFDEREIYLVALALDVETGEIMNAVEKRLEFDSSTKEVESAFNRVALFPNPALSEAKLELISSENIETELLLTDVLGATVRTERLSIVKGKNLISIPLDRLVAGVYQLTLSTNKTLITKQLVVTKP